MPWLAIGVAAAIAHTPGDAKAGDLPRDVVSAWVEAAANDAVTIRAISRSDSCPRISVDGRLSSMQLRAAPDGAFPIRVCEISVPRKARSATLGHRKLPLIAAAINRIVVFGDTGCRLKGPKVQLCNDPKEWPFATVARRAAARQPDLVIHVGDYLYREVPCPAGISGCAGTPVGDNWAVWSADFFEPAAPLLASAPWIVVRGNHELCDRAGKGWFRLLDPAPLATDCQDFTEPYVVRVGSLSLMVFDGAAADDDKANVATVLQEANAFGRAIMKVTEPFWLLTHRPVWGLKSADVNMPINRTEQAAIDPLVPSNLEMVVSGHVHTFASFAFGGARPAQLVAGTGGSLYDKLTIPQGSTVEIDGLAATRAFALTRYGYVLLERERGGWRGTLFDAADDHVLGQCSFRGRDIACGEP